MKFFSSNKGMIKVLARFKLGLGNVLYMVGIGCALLHLGLKLVPSFP